MYRSMLLLGVIALTNILTVIALLQALMESGSSTVLNIVLVVSCLFLVAATIVLIDLPRSGKSRFDDR